MRNPWLDIALADYEGHMSSPEVAQAPMIAGVFAELLQAYRPHSVAVIGCAGGNGFERIDRAQTARVVGVDINAIYLAEARRRFDAAFDTLELICADIAVDSAADPDPLGFAPVDLIFAALVFEYVEPRMVMPRLAARLRPGGRLAVLLQLPAVGIPAITPTFGARLAALAPLLQLVAPDAIAEAARAAGLTSLDTLQINLSTGKTFQLLSFAL